MSRMQPWKFFASHSRGANGLYLDDAAYIIPLKPPIASDPL